jgi:hypothetical protein
MNRSHYLANPVVQSFITWMSRNLNSAVFQHQYVNRMTGKQWKCANLSDAYLQYNWDHPAITRLDVKKGADAHSNGLALLALKQDLQRALGAPTADDAACQAAIDVMIWGGVQAYNIDWLNQNRQGLAAHFMAVRDAIDHADLSAEVLLNENLRFNAGLTKVYSLICRDFIIYDSRVAAALGWAVVKFCAEHGIADVPAVLAFPWAPARKTSASAAKNRNPGQGTWAFPALVGGTLHAQWNMRASWLLRGVLDAPAATDSEFFTGDGLRKLEAALFMIGYDLDRNTEQSVTAVTPSSNDFDWIDGRTAAQRRAFRYRITPDEIIIDSKPRFALATINLMLNQLRDTFGTSPFPLANSADGVRNGTSPEGIGLAYLRATSGKGNVPDTSKLAAVLSDLGVLSITGKRGYWVLNPDLATVDRHQQIDIAAVLARMADDRKAA